LFCFVFFSNLLVLKSHQLHVALKPMKKLLSHYLFMMIMDICQYIELLTMDMKQQ